MRYVKAASGLVALGALVSLVGCSGEESPPLPDPNQGGSPSGGSGGMAVASCPDGPEPTTDTDTVRVGVVDGQIVDENGDTASAGLVQICGKNICINANVNDTGALHAVIDKDMDAPACKYGNGRTFGKLALPIGGGDTDLGTLTTVHLPSFGEGMPLTPGETATSAGVSLTLTDNARVEIDTLTYEDETEYGFRAALVPDDALAKLDQGFVLAFTLAPLETRICPSPSLTIENSIGLTPGSALELFIHGLDVLEEWAPYAGWEKVGEGQVSDDGATLDFAQGVPLLTAIGIRQPR